MKTIDSKAIRLARTRQVDRALIILRRNYPTLSDPELLKLGLSKLVRDYNDAYEDLAELDAMTVAALGEDYLNDPAEDIYHEGMGKKVHLGRDR